MSLKKSSHIAAALAAGFMGLSGLATVTHAGTAPSMRSEEAAHPRPARTIREMRDALHELREAPDDFGNNKAAAIHDTEAATHSLRKALYYRLRMDDAALDRAQ